MSRTRLILLISFLFSLCLVSACKMTEQQIRPPQDIQELSSTFNQQAAIEGREFAGADSKPSRKGTKVQWFLLTAAILAAVVMIFASDREEKKRAIPPKRSIRKRHKK